MNEFATSIYHTICPKCRETMVVRELQRAGDDMIIEEQCTTCNYFDTFVIEPYDEDYEIECFN